MTLLPQDELSILTRLNDERETRLKARRPKPAEPNNVVDLVALLKGRGINPDTLDSEDTGDEPITALSV
jgi:hypothetical protein